MVNQCTKCKAKDSFLQIISRACDGNIVIHPDGREFQGYLTGISGLCDSDGLTIKICIKCGQLDGLDLDQLNTFAQ